MMAMTHCRACGRYFDGWAAGPFCSPPRCEAQLPLPFPEQDPAPG